MADVKIGKSAVYTSSLGLGANAIGGHNLFADLDDEQGKDILRTALRNGITLIDTAYIYGEGRSEELIGAVLQEKEFDRSKVIIATKAAHSPGNPDKKDNSPAFLTQAVEDALARLQTAYIDIFYIHFPDEQTPKNEAIAALHQLKEAGKIRAIGVSNFSLDQLQEANQDGYVDILEEEYSLLHRQAETTFFPYLAEHDISFVPYFPLASGLLTGKYEKEPTFAENDIRSSNPDFKGERFAKIVETVNQLKPIADNYDATITQLVLAWYLKNPEIAAVIPGAKKVEQVTANAQAMDIHLTKADYQLIDHLFAVFNETLDKF